MDYEHSLRIADNLSTIATFGIDGTDTGDLVEQLEAIDNALLLLARTVALAALGNLDKLADLHDL